MCYAAVNLVADLSGNKCDISERSIGHAAACLCFWLTVTITIHGSVKRNGKIDFELLSSRVID